MDNKCYVNIFISDDDIIVNTTVFPITSIYNNSIMKYPESNTNNRL